jgi:hypothetical protein
VFEQLEIRQCTKIKSTPTTENRNFQATFYFFIFLDHFHTGQY